MFYNKITLSITRFDHGGQHQVNSDTQCCHSKPLIVRNSEMRQYINLIQCCCAMLLIYCKSYVCLIPPDGDCIHSKHLVCKVVLLRNVYK
jgi:hypothetical protein